MIYTPQKEETRKAGKNIKKGEKREMNEAMKTAFSDALTSIQGDFNSNVTTALPVALGIMGITLGIRLAVSFFKSVTH